MPPTQELQASRGTKKLPIEKYKKTRRGFTKVSYKKPKGHVEGTLFNPISINLYNEDIKEIIQSNGLMGLILDERILGAGGGMVNPEIKKNGERVY